MLTLNNISSPKGAHRNTKRIGRGQASGQGTQAGKGHKGQKARKSGHVRIGFEGGTMPLFMRLPKFGFNNTRFAQKYAEVSLRNLSNFEGEVTIQSLIESGLLKGQNRNLPVKILGYSSFDKKLQFSNELLFTKGAKVQIEKAGGSII